MNIRNYCEGIVNTKRDEWKFIDCWGAFTGPSYYNQFSSWTSGNEKGIEVNSHKEYVVLKAEISVSFAWGLEHNRSFYEEWLDSFSNKKTSSGFIDFFYNGCLVHRDIYVSVDDGRVNMPLPDRVFDKYTHQVVRYTVPREKFEFYKILNTDDRKYKENFIMTGIEIVDKKWFEE